MVITTLHFWFPLGFLTVTECLQGVRTIHLPNHGRKGIGSGREDGVTGNEEFRTERVSLLFFEVAPSSYGPLPL